jgi:endonuclease/exonuclease/phosphatase (EEP) superfamily protein YafD
MEAGAFLTAVFSIATAFDQLHRVLELFSHFRLQYLVVSALLFVFLAWLRRRGMAALMLAVTVVNAAYVAPWYWPRAAPGDTASLGLLHANILAGNDDIAPLLAHIEREQPDIVFVQELTHRHLRLLETLATTYPHTITRPHDDPFGLGAWSKRPFLAADVIATPPRQNPSLRIVVDYDGEPVTIFSTHPVPPIGAGFYAARNAQLAYLADLVVATRGSTVVIGDLNITPWAAHYRDFEAATGLVNAQRGHGIKPSWPLFLPFAMIPIDHALFSEDLVANETRALGPVGSDHLPLLVRIARR